MKKIIFVLMFSLGLVNVANAESVCYQDYYNDVIGVSSFAKWLDDYDIMSENRKKNNKILTTWKKLLVRTYVGEIKRSDKESLCLFMDVAITDYLKTTLTPQEIERFERYLVKIGYYDSYESDKNNYLNALKLLKHFNKIEYWYSKYGKEEHSHPQMWSFVNDVEILTNYNNNPRVYAERFVYGKSVGDAFEFQRVRDSGDSLSTMKDTLKKSKGDKYCPDYSIDCYETKDLKYVIQWAESKINESKQKDSK